MIVVEVAQPCPDCQNATVTLWIGLKVKPIGSFSLAGQNPKFAATDTATVTCSSCGMSRDGNLVDLVMSEDGKTIVSGSFVETKE